MRKIILAAVILLVFPSMAYASWWNPLTWNWNPVSWVAVIMGDTNTQSQTPSKATIATTSIATTTPNLKPSDNSVGTKSSAADTRPQASKPPTPVKITANNEPVITVAPPQTPQNTQSQPTSHAPTPTPPSTNVCNGTLCNGLCYNACPAGQDFICPAGGGHAYCQLSQQQQEANLEAQKQQELAQLESALQSWENELAAPNNQIQQIQNEMNQDQCSAAPNLSGAGGEQGLEQIQQAQTCASLADEIINVQNGEVPAENEIAYIQREIYQVENTP